MRDPVCRPRDFALDVLKALKIDPKGVRKISMVVTAGGLPTVTIERLLYEKESATIGEILQKYKLVEEKPKEAVVSEADKAVQLCLNVPQAYDHKFGSGA